MADAVLNLSLPVALAEDSCFLQCFRRPSHGIMLKCRSGVS